MPVTEANCVPTFLLGAGIALLLIAAFRDVALRLLPNWTSAALALIGAALRLRDHSLPLGVAAALGVFAVTYVCWRRGWMGGGDVKLLAACALLAPPAAVPALIILTTLGGGLLALLYLSLQRLLPRHSPAAGPGRRRWLPIRVLRVECRRIARRAPPALRLRHRRRRHRPDAGARRPDWKVRRPCCFVSSCSP